MSHGWIAVDLDGTLAYYDKWVAVDDIGEPIPLMLERVKAWLAEGKDVRIFTARAHSSHCKVTGRWWEAEEIVKVIQDWTEKHTGYRLPVTATKDYMMVEQWDDRAVQVVPNTGRTLAEEYEAEMTALRGKP